MIEYFEKRIIEDVIVERVNLCKMTLIESKVFWERLQDDIVQGHRKIIADLSNCKNVDSTLIGVLMQAQNLLSKSQGNLKLVLPNKETVKIIELLGVSEIINVYKLLDDAVTSFNSRSNFKKIAVA